MTETSDLSPESINPEPPITEPLSPIPPPKVSWKVRVIEWGVASCIMFVLVAMLLPNVRSSREPARRSHCKNNLKQLGLALHNYVDTYGTLPPAYTVDAQGRALHSWRTLLLPYLDQKPLYDKIDFSKAWDDPANAEAYKTVVPVYECPSNPVSANQFSTNESRTSQTTYLAIAASYGCFRPSEGRRFSEITDGLSKTVMVIEVDPIHAVHWMSPYDADERLVLGFKPDSKLAHSGGVHALLGDGSVRFLSANLSTETRRALMSFSGGEVVQDY